MSGYLWCVSGYGRCRGLFQCLDTNVYDGGSLCLSLFLSENGELWVFGLLTGVMVGCDG